MITYENECLGCDVHCIGNACPYRSVKHYYCDNCRSDVDVLYRHDNDELCIDCLIKRMEVVK